MKLHIYLEDEDNAVSERGKDWVGFSEKVLNHIERYTVPQYGDKGTDLITGYTAEKCVECVEKYAKRFGSNQRAGQDKLDMMKIAHYSQCAYDKIEEGVFSGNQQAFIGVAEDTLNDADDWLVDKGYYGKQVKITVELL